MASWMLLNTPWVSLSRLAWTARSPSNILYPWLHKSHFSTPSQSQETPSMIALKNQPYPTAGLDLSVFEDDTEDYGPHLPAVYPEFIAAQSSCHVLAKLVRDGDIEDAERVIQELAEIGVPIQQNVVYERAALQALRRSGSLSKNRLTDFLKWWSLVPPKREWTAPLPSFSTLNYAVVSHSPFPDLPLIMRFAIVAASKGFTSKVALHTIPVIFRYAPPSVSAAFLNEFIQAEMQYHSSGDQDPDESIPRSRPRWKSLYGLAIRAQCSAGRPQAGLELYNIARDRRVPLSTSTVRHLSAHLGTPLEPSRPIALEDAPSVTKNESNVSPPSTAPGQPLIPTLRHLKTSLRSESPPSASLLKRFMEQCVHDERSNTLHALRTKAYRSSKRHLSISTWALSEMLYHLEHNDRREFLLTFSRHFHVVGIPIRITKFLQKTYWKEIRHRQTHGDSTLRSILPADYPLAYKLAPSSHHTALIWRLCVQLTTSPEGLEELYRELLSQVSLSRGITLEGESTGDPPVVSTEGYLDPPSDSKSYPRAIPTPVQFDDAHFNTFIFAFANRMGPSRATAVLLDMYRLGIRPSVNTLTVLASGFARAGDMPHLLRLLDRMERSSVFDDPAISPASSLSVEDTQVRVRKGRGKKSSKLPAPNVVTYTAVIRWLLNGKRWEDAGKIAVRLFDEGRYVRGRNRMTDGVLGELEARVPWVVSLGRQSTQVASNYEGPDSTPQT